MHISFAKLSPTASFTITPTTDTRNGSIAMAFHMSEYLCWALEAGIA